MSARQLLLSSLLILPLYSQAANIVIVNSDGANEGFNDNTVVSAVGGNTATTLGAQRLAVFQRAADILETYIDIQVDVNVEARFDPLSCNAGSAVLGSAGSKQSWRDFTGAPHASTWYHSPLANNLFGADIGAVANGGANQDNEIQATFNSDIDNNNNCLNGVDWYYGFDDPAATGNPAYTNDSSLLSVVIHEILHGLGVSSMVASNGVLNGGYMDAYSRNLYDASTATSWTAMNDSQRATSITNTGNLVWDGSNVNTAAAAIPLTNGLNGGRTEMYAPSPYEGGSSVSHFSKDATPNEIMEPSYTEFLDGPGLSQQLLQDMGWAILTPAANNAPVLAAIGAQSSVEDNNKIISLSATDSDSDPVTFSASSDNGSVSTSVSGNSLTLTPAANFFGTANITVTASDGSDSDSETFVYTVTSDNDLPSFTSAATGSTNAGVAKVITLSGSDVETNAGSLVFSVQAHNSAEVTPVISSGTTLTMTPVGAFTGDTTLTLRVTDGDAGYADQSYILTVNAVANIAPVFTSSANLSSLYSDAISHTLTASDADTASGSLTYALVSHNSAQLNASVSGTGLSVSAVNDFVGSSTVRVSVNDGSNTVTQDINVQIFADFELQKDGSPLSDGGTTSGTLNNIDFSLSGGDNSYTVTVDYDGQNVESALLSNTGNDYQLAMPASGAFAGDYTITVTDSNGESASFTISRPLRLTATISDLIAASSVQQIFVEGAPSGTVIDLHENDGDSLIELQVSNSTITQVTAPDDAANFNRAIIDLVISEPVNATAANISADSAGIAAGDIDLTVLPTQQINLRIEDSSNQAIEGANIEVQDNRLASWQLDTLYTSDSNGQVSFVMPADQAPEVIVSATDFNNKQSTLVLSADEQIIALQTLSLPVTISGMITTTTLDFDLEAPGVSLLLDDGSLISANVVKVDAAKVEFTVSFDLAIQAASTLQLRHSDINFDQDVSNTDQNRTLNIQLDNFELRNSNGNSTDVEVVQVSNDTAGGGAAYWLLVLFGLILFSKTRRTSRN